MNLQFIRHSKLVDFFVYVTAISCQLQFITPDGKRWICKELKSPIGRYYLVISLAKL